MPRTPESIPASVFMTLEIVLHWAVFLIHFMKLLATWSMSDIEILVIL